MSEKKLSRWSFREISFGIICFAFAIVVQGAVPFVMTPNLQQAVWSMGFAQSFANNPSVFDVFANDIGIPGPASMAFGLAGAYPASLLLRFGIQAADAYTLSAVLWFSVSYLSAIRLGRAFGSNKLIAAFGAMVWLCMPIIWGHSCYSMVSWGMSLLPFYFLAAVRLFLLAPNAKILKTKYIFTYLAATVVSIFMDGYIFMMFASGASILLIYSIIKNKLNRSYLLLFAAPIHATSFAIAYLLFRLYIGKSGFEPESLDFFRGWGVDLFYILFPTTGMLWIPDILGLSIPRSEVDHFGDSSVWATTFFLPLLLLGLIAWWMMRIKFKMATGILLVGLFAIYMALGPSLKVNSKKPPELQKSDLPVSRAMLASHAVMPTGSAWISEHIPGFNVMRASYRWSSLSIFAFWCLLMMWVAMVNHKNPLWCGVVLTIVILFNLPPLKSHTLQNINYRGMFQQIDIDLVLPLKNVVNSGETAVFIPMGNDFAANYLAPKAGFRTYNIGGDKNVLQASKSWPKEIRAIGDQLNCYKALNALLSGAADLLIIPHFHLLNAFFQWPPSVESVSSYRQDADSLFALWENKEVTNASHYPLFSIVRLNEKFETESEKSSLRALILQEMAGEIYPLSVGRGSHFTSTILGDGWHGPESDQIWSKAEAELNFPVSESMVKSDESLELEFFVYNASKERPVNVIFQSAENGWEWEKKVTANSNRLLSLKIPLSGACVERKVRVLIPEATSPKKSSGSVDWRILGIALKRVSLTSSSDTAELASQKYPFSFGNSGNGASLLVSGWHPQEADFTWSESAATLQLPISNLVEGQTSPVVLKFFVFGATPQRPVDVYFETKDAEPVWTEKITATSSSDYIVEIPLESAKGVRSVGISVPSAISPKELSGSADPRILGIALKEITIGAPSSSSTKSQTSTSYPLLFQNGENGVSLLSEGWHSPEATHTWSQAEAKLVLPVPKGFETGECRGVLKFWVFGASPTRPVDLFFESADSAWQWSEKITVTSEGQMSIAIPLGISPKTIRIRVPSATSPEKLIGSPDPRIIGIALQEIVLDSTEGGGN
jgi:hypothetical protein